MPEGCLSDAAVEAFVAGSLDAGQRADVERHLLGCRDCCTLIAECTRWSLGTMPADDDQDDEAEAGSHPRPRPLAPSTRLGRYRIVRPMAAGGGGAVYEGFDPQLRRRIAIKVLHLPASGGADARSQLVREAQALAKLSHPNVVGIHDAGVFEGQVFLVLEYVEGETLAARVSAGRHGWREILALYLDAGRGLAAAHSAGVVHGDFKPENVLIGSDGRARVADFGLAHAGGRATPEAPAGTPRYMAPEQWKGQAPDERSDQFSFCLALLRALGLEAPDLPAAVAPAHADPGTPRRSGQGRIPPPIVEALRRGVRAAPHERHADVRALLTALERAASRGRTRRMAAVALGLIAAGVAVTVSLTGRAPSEGDTSAVAPAASPRCGNARPDPGEECDDGNANEDDGCSTRCLSCGGSDGGFLSKADGHCYTFHESGASWWAAANACGERGGALVGFGRSFELKTFEAAVLSGSKPSFWIGLRHHMGRGFVWQSGERLDDTFHGLPTEVTGPGAGGCIYATPAAPGETSRFELGWRSGDCQAARPFACERAPWRARPGTGHLYRTLYDGRTWDEAEAACRRQGAHLATLTDPGELAFVAAGVAVYAWIGATDRDKEGEFRWADGTPFTFGAFAPDQPNDGQRDQKPGQDCLALGPDGRWHDWICGAWYPYICEIDAGAK